MEIWNTIPLDFVQKLILSLPKCAYEVYMAKGGHIKFY